jgi:deoxyribose-phosphate aldolase
MITFSDYPKLTDAGWKKRVEKLAGKKHNQAALQQIYRDLLACIDLTTLEGTDNSEKITDLCTKAFYVEDADRNIPNVAAVCVYPPFVRQCKSELQGKGIKVACVAGAFPSGQSPIKLKVEEVKYAVCEGADEIDMVISRGTFLQGEYKKVYEEIFAIKDVCNKAHLKVILETGELVTHDNIRKASEIALLAGADFLKTSTGKTQPAATELAAVVMCDTIMDYSIKTGSRIGFKAAGGISEPDVAVRYYNIVEGLLGKEWLNKDLFRIGASRLVDNLLKVIQ